MLLYVQSKSLQNKLNCPVEDKISFRASMSNCSSAHFTVHAHAQLKCLQNKLNSPVEALISFRASMSKTCC